MTNNDLSPCITPPIVTAIVVTYNREKLLMITLDGLVKQTYKPAQVIIIDNASGESTFLTLRDHGWIPKDKEFRNNHIVHKSENHGFAITYIRLQENEGGAGGFHEGVKEACRSESNWFFLMDDDVEPTPELLSKLLEYCQESECIHPAKQYADGTAITWEGRFSEISGRTIWNGNAGFKKGLRHVGVNYGCFEGMLVSRRVVEKIGLPDKRFFIVNDDLIYGWLASKITNVIYVNYPGLIKHRPVEKQISFLGFADTEIGPVTQYFNIRNHFLLTEYLRAGGSSVIAVTAFMYLKFLKEIMQAAFSRNLMTLKMIWTGISDGHRKKFGRPEFF